MVTISESQDQYCLNQELVDGGNRRSAVLSATFPKRIAEALAKAHNRAMGFTKEGPVCGIYPPCGTYPTSCMLEEGHYGGHDLKVNHKNLCWQNEKDYKPKFKGLGMRIKVKNAFLFFW